MHITTWAQMQFVRDIKFPRFTVKAGERWTFLVDDSRKSRLLVFDGTLGSFPFAGGECRTDDAKLVYVGPDYPTDDGTLLSAASL